MMLEPRWTDAQVYLVAHHAGLGKSAEAIARVFAGQRECTRNMIIGLCRRQGIKLARRGKGAASKIATRPRAAAKVAKTTKPPKIVMRRSIQRRVIPPAPTQLAGVALADAEHNHCRWPFGDGSRICGEATFYAAYCEAHAKQAFQRVPRPITASQEVA